MYCLLRYHQREVLLRASQDNNNTKWAAFMSFLNEMYGLVRTSMAYSKKSQQLTTKVRENYN